MKRQQIIDAIRDQWIKDYGSLEDGQDRNGYFVIGFVDSVLKELEQLTKLDVVGQSEEFPSREDAYKEGLSRKRRHEKNIVWKAKIFAAGAMWAKMKLTGISDVIGNNN
jgi:hypothetical protein